MQYFGLKLKQAGIPIVWPPGGHAVFLKANDMFTERPWDDFVTTSFGIELVRRYGIRTVPIGYLEMNLDLTYEQNGNKLPEVMPKQKIRLTVPAQMYHIAHIDYTVNALTELFRDYKSLPSVRVAGGKYEKINRIFSLAFEPYQKD